MTTVLTLTGHDLTPEQVYDAGVHATRVQVAEDAWARIRAGRDVVDRVLRDEDVVYGINTGFGNFANVLIEPDKLGQLQVNLIRSHACGVGKPLSRNATRRLLLLRINVFCKGHSGVREVTVTRMLAALNAGCLPCVPQQGTVGASGDLAPLAHLALGLMGEGEMWTDNVAEDRFEPAHVVLARRQCAPIELHAKEGLALINGTQLITSIGVTALVRARRAARQADIIAALTIEALKGSSRPFHPIIHATRPHAGQSAVANRLTRLLLYDGSKSSIANSHVNCGRVQDAYTLRCVPQIHGVCHDMLEFVYSLLSVECNSATDNPMIFDASFAQEHERMRAYDAHPFHHGVVAAASPRLGPRGPPGHTCPSCGTEAPSAFSLSESRKRKREKPAAAAASTGEKSTRGLDSPHLHSAVHLPSGRYRADHDYERLKTVPLGDNRGIIISGGNFHGEYPAKACDMLALAIHEVAAVSERRVERLVNPHLSGLPAFLVNEGGLNSGFMIAHCTAASLVSESKVLCHPSSIDSLSTSAGQEDHVSMGGFAARKALRVVEHTEMVLAIELLAACQALEFSRPHKTTPPLEAVYDIVRSRVASWDRDRIMAPDMEAAVDLIRSEAVWEAVQRVFAQAEEEKEKEDIEGGAVPPASKMRRV